LTALTELPKKFMIFRQYQGLRTLMRWLPASGRPMRSARIVIPGVSSTTTIRFDGAGVPHVEAGTSTDLPFALGWLHANDRLFQMELARRTAAGRLAEVVGRVAVAGDAKARHLRLRETAEMLARNAGPVAREWLEAYSGGVNAWVSNRDRDLPPEFRFWRIRPAVWEPADSMTLVLMMALELSLLSQESKETRLRWTLALDSRSSRDLIDAAALGLGDPAGSNAFVTHPASGGVLLANDTHQLLRLPAWWFRVLLRAPGFEAVGWTLPGFPALIVGFNGRVAWGFTSHMLDDHDVFLEDWDARTGTVRRGRDRVTVAVDETYIDVRGDQIQPLELRSTDIGPLLPPDSHVRLPARSIAWTAYYEARPLDALLSIASASSLDEVVAARQAYVAPAMNLLACDQTGASLLMLLGAIPDRPAGVDRRLPLDASRCDLHWCGLRDIAANPIQWFGPGEVVVSANDAQLARLSSDPYLADFDSASRVERLRQLLEAKPSSALDALRLQTDTASPLAVALVRAVPDLQLSGDAGNALALLRTWDGTLDGAGAATLYRYFTRDLFCLTFGRLIDVAHVRVSLRERLLLALLRGEVSTLWLPNNAIPEALNSGWRTCVRRWGVFPAKWKYREVHRLTLRHPFSHTTVGHWLFGRGPFGVPGSTSTPNAFDGDWNGDEREVVRGPGLRWVVDLANPDQSRAIVPGGQSGHPYDPHYADQLRLYLGGAAAQVAWSREAVLRSTVSTVVIEPDKNLPTDPLEQLSKGTKGPRGHPRDPS
jgi:penicillin amidase